MAEYLRCDGTVTVNGDNTVACDSWLAVTEDDLLANLTQNNHLNSDDFSLLAGLTLVILMAAFGVRMVLKHIILNSSG